MKGNQEPAKDVDQMTYYIQAKRFLLEDGEWFGGYLCVEDGRFGAIVSAVPPEAHVVDWGNYTVAPGLFDTHIHGMSGVDVMDGTIEAIQHMSEAMLPVGVTRFLPTTLTGSTQAIEQALTSIRKAVEQSLPGAQSEGVFIEGPYFTEAHKGAQNESYFRDASYEEYKHWQTLAGGMIVKIAIAPERTDSLAFIEAVTKEGITVGLAHTDASHAQCEAAIEAGANVFVHLFNGMRGMHHREPGVVGTALTEKKSFVELICDGHHVHPTMATLAMDVKGDKTVLITDCMRAGMMPDGNYMLGELPIEVNDGIAETASGSLAGSTLTLIDAVKHAFSWGNDSLHSVWHLASLSPAKSIGKDTELGSIARGKYADYVVIDDQFIVQATAVEGKVLYKQIED